MQSRSKTSTKNLFEQFWPFSAESYVVEQNTSFLATFFQALVILQQSPPPPQGRALSPLP